ncbi:transglycosylase SLT domain-containing protein [Alcanivorax sp. DP30]|uniref:transglycosylase SLT domain-containing protein n=1 Tax=Alcanivorax sp. DP30 TaxID=2606217 RepID=UPI001370D1E7|nr:transglycosylase SLT domain-containing protein [Alcanivorax sp. DP30]MZR61467.1 transglycosylase SLT domain-containing protein [Alcanivorax sp. DP30]
MVRAAVLIACSLMASLALAETDTFRQALDAARNDDWESLNRLESALDDGHPLQAYLEFHRIRAGLPELSPEKVQAYAERYSDSPLPGDIRDIAIVSYAQAKRWDALLAISDKPPGPVTLKCYYYQAKLASDDDSALQEAARLWAHGSSRPNACDPLFDAAREAGVIDEKAIWERQRLAFEAGNYSLMRYLNRSLKNSEYETAGNWLKKLYRSPQDIDDLPRGLTKARKEDLREAALYRWIYTDTVAARAWFEKHESRIKNEDARQSLGRRLAWYSTIRGIEENRQWLDDWLESHSDTELLSQRARRAIIEQNWDATAHWIGKLPQQEQADSRWLYWQARALEATGSEDDARGLFQQAAQGRNFFAFLAADRLGEPYRFSDEPYSAETPFKAPPALNRIKLLQELEEDSAAHREWLWLLWHSDKEQQRALAEYALNQQWYSLAVEASIQSKSWNTLAWRFPPAYQAQFEKEALENDLDPWLAMAVSRRESAFNPRARSGVGASGLMQLMPATARKVASDANQARPTQAMLYDQNVNIGLGTRYLAELLDQFNGNRLLALAAYNAGPHRIDNWLAEDDDKAVPVDVWVESIPFRETRDYVQAVLTYRVLFIGLHDDQPRTAQLISDKENESSYTLSMLE